MTHYCKEGGAEKSQHGVAEATTAPDSTEALEHGPLNAFKKIRPHKENELCVVHRGLKQFEKG